MSIAKGIQESMTRGSWIRKMFEEGIKLKQIHGEFNVYDYTLGNPYVDPPKAFFDALETVVHERKRLAHGYMQNSGFPETRQRVADELSKDTGRKYGIDNIIMTVGAAGAMNVAFKSILEPGDEVVVVAPYFPEYNFYINNHQGVRVTSLAKDDFLPDIADLDHKIGPKTKALIINSPCNPSGVLVPKDVLLELAALLERKNAEYGKIIYLMSDEPYRKLVFDGQKAETPASFYDHTLIGTSHSKDLSLAGERIGYLAINPDTPAAKDLFAAATFCNRILGFVNAPALMQRVLQALPSFESPVALYQAKRDVLFNGLKDIGYDVRCPEGTFFMFPKSPIPNDLDFIEVLRRHRVLVSPGTGFEFPGYFRLSFAVDDRIIENSLPAFKEAFREVQ